MSWRNYIPICDAMVLLMCPLIEIAIHDIESGSIVYIKGSLSNRKVGDPSLLDKEQLLNIDPIVYQKVNFNGKLVKSVSVVLEEKWLLCINSDVSLFTKMKELSQVLLQMNEVRPKALFKNDWQEQLHLSIQDYLQAHQLSFDFLSYADKKALVRHLFDLGAFNEKNAANYVAKTLSLGRATVFNYLKEWRTS